MSRKGARSEAGFTLVEVIVAALILVLVVAAAASLFASGSKSSLAAQRHAEEIEVADQQIEQIREEVKTAGSFSNLRMQQSPVADTSPPTVDGRISTDPNAFVSGSCFYIETNWDAPLSSGNALSSVSTWPGCPTGAEPLAVSQPTSAATAVATPPRPVAIGSATGTAYTYVTYTNLGCNPGLVGASSCYNPSSPATACMSSTGCFTPLGDAMRVTVAIVLNNGGTNNTGSAAEDDIGQNSPVYVSTILTNPVPSNQPNTSVGLSLGVGLG